MIYQTEKALNELGDNLPATDRAQIDEQIENLKASVDREDVNAIRDNIQALQGAAHALSQQMYAQQDAGNVNTARTITINEPDDIIDAEFAEM